MNDTEIDGRSQRYNGTRRSGLGTLLTTGLIALTALACEKGDQDPCITGVCPPEEEVEPAYREHRIIDEDVMVPREEPVIYPCEPGVGDWDVSLGGAVRSTSNVEADNCEFEQDEVVDIPHRASTLIEIQDADDPALITRIVPFTVTGMDDAGNVAEFDDATRWHLSYRLPDAPESDLLRKAIEDGSVTGQARIGTHTLSVGDSATINVPSDIEPSTVTRWEPLGQDAYWSDRSGNLLSRDEAIGMVGADAVNAVQPGDTLEILSVWARAGMAEAVTRQAYAPAQEGTFTSGIEDNNRTVSYQNVEPSVYIGGGGLLGIGVKRTDMITESDVQSLVGARSYNRAFPDARTNPTGSLLIGPGIDNEAVQFEVIMGNHQVGYWDAPGSLPYEARNGGIVIHSTFADTELRSTNGMQEFVPAAGVPTVDVDWQVQYDIDTMLRGPEVVDKEEIDRLKENRLEDALGGGM